VGLKIKTYVLLLTWKPGSDKQSSAWLNNIQQFYLLIIAD